MEARTHVVQNPSALETDLLAFSDPDAMTRTRRVRFDLIVLQRLRGGEAARLQRDRILSAP